MGGVTNAITNTVGASISGIKNRLTVTNSSNTASSIARMNITVGGSSAGNPYHRFLVNGQTSWSQGIDNDASDCYVLSQNANLGTNNCFTSTVDGEVNLPLQPTFRAYISIPTGNVTGDGTDYFFIWDTEVFDIGGNYDHTTGTFTAPIDGVYEFCICAYAQGNTGPMSSQSITYFLNGIADSRIKTGKGIAGVDGSQLAFTRISLSAGDAITARLNTAAGPKSVSVLNSSSLSYICGWLDY